MFEVEKYSTVKLLLISLISSLFVIYPNIACLPWELSFLDDTAKTFHIIFFLFRYVFFALLIWLLLLYNLRKLKTPQFKRRLLSTASLTTMAYLIYVVISLFTKNRADCFTSILLFQFLVTAIICTFIGHIVQLYSEQRCKDLEIEQLKVENLQSRCDALAGQIHPHFLFNSLNGLTSLIRKNNEEKTLEYVNKLSDVFRYILQSDKKGLVTLGEELEFIQAIRYMLEVRFANKLDFNIQVDPKYFNLKIPVLSLLPLIDNVVVHNIIDSDHKMTVTIRLNEAMELMIANPSYPKLNPPTTHGTGLKNLENRFLLLMNKEVRITFDEKKFSVFLPLKK